MTITVESWDNKIPHTELLRADEVLTVTTAAGSSALVSRYSGGTLLDSTSMGASETATFGEYSVDLLFLVTALTGSATFSKAESNAAIADRLTLRKAVAISETYAGTDASYQPVAVDLELAAGAGSNTGTNPKFLSPIMGNVSGADLTQDSNYLAGVVGAYSVTGTQSTTYPTAGVMGLAFEAAAVDGLVMGVLDGDDGGGATRAKAAFGVRVNNSNSGSGVDYGVDLYSPTNANYGTPQGLNVAKAEVRMSNEVCILSGAGAPVDYTDGSPPASGEGYAEIGSLYVDITAGKLYLNGGTKAQPVWKIVTSA